MKYALALLLLAATPKMYEHEPGSFPAGAKAERLLIVQGGWRMGQSAVYVGDRKEVQHLYDLIAGNGRTMYACGAHWWVVFVLADGRQFTLPINEECENFTKHNREILGILHGYFDRALKTPTQYRVRVLVPPQADVAAVRTALEHAGYPTFLLTEDWKRKPSGEFVATAKGEDAAQAKLTHLVQRLVRERKATVIDPGSFLGMEGYDYTLKATLAFPFGTTREDVAKIAGADAIHEFYVPNDYPIDIVTTEPYTPPLAARLRAIDARILTVSP